MSRETRETRLSGSADPALLLRRLAGTGAPVLYVHGATFPSALSVAYRFAGRSWMDDLADRGFDVWAFDFAGYGGSERQAALSGAQDGAPVGRALDAGKQIARVVDHLLRVTGRARVSLIAHSWGTIPAGLFAAQHPERIARLCLFGPIGQRDTAGLPAPESAVTWRLVSVAEQLARFASELPDGHAPVLLEPELHAWGPAYLASDPEAGARVPRAIKIPAGPVADVLAAWSGALGWRPEDVRAPALIVRGEWDRVSSDADAAWLLRRLGSPIRELTTVPAGTHLLHLERNRDALFAAAGKFLAAELV